MGMADRLDDDALVSWSAAGGLDELLIVDGAEIIKIGWMLCDTWNVE